MILWTISLQREYRIAAAIFTTPFAQQALEAIAALNFLVPECGILLHCFDGHESAIVLQIIEDDGPWHLRHVVHDPRPAVPAQPLATR